MDNRAALYNHDFNKLSHTLVYNIPILTSLDPVEQYATEVSINNILGAFENSLNEDGYIAIDDVFKRGSYKGYLDLLVEHALCETCYRLESCVYDDYNDHQVGYDDVMSYMVDNSHDFHETLTNFAFFVLTGVISNLINFVKNISTTYGIKVDTYKISKAYDDNSVINITYFVDKTPNIY